MVTEDSRKLLSTKQYLCWTLKDDSDWDTENNMFTLRKEGDQGIWNRGDGMELRRTFETKGRSFLKMETGRRRMRTWTTCILICV